MTTAQKIIKYCAIAFAIFLIVSIVSGILGAVSGVSYILGGKTTVTEMEIFPITSSVKELKIELSAAKLRLKTGDRFQLESNHKYLEWEEKDGCLSIWDDAPHLGKDMDKIQVTLTIPEGTEFRSADISTGAGTFTVDELSARRLRLNLGAGEVKIASLSASGSALIDGGAGEITIDGGSLNNLDFDMGVGEVNLTSRITGDSELDYGVGELNLTLLGKPEDYRIRLDKGLGEARLDGQKMYDDAVYGNGIHSIEIDGGVGELKIEFTD